MKLSFDEAMEIVNKCSVPVMMNGWTRFDSKTAWISSIVHVGELPYQLFKSYSTIVALVDISDGVVYRFGKWSSTTSKQTAQFCNRYYRDFEQVQF